MRFVRGVAYTIAALLLLSQVALAVFAFYVKQNNQQLLIIVGGSMEPTYSIGDAVILDKNADNIEPGTVVTYHDSGKLTTHRVIDIKTIKGHPWLQTQGDANETPDPNLTDKDAVIGIPMYSIERGGYVANWLQTREGRIATFGPALLVVFLIEVGHIRREWRRNDEDSSEDSDDNIGDDAEDDAGDDAGNQALSDAAHSRTPPGSGGRHAKSSTNRT